jgi:hypothetical protein
LDAVSRILRARHASSQLRDRAAMQSRAPSSLDSAVVGRRSGGARHAGPCTTCGPRISRLALPFGASAAMQADVRTRRRPLRLGAHPSHRRGHSTLRAHRAHLMWRNSGSGARLALHPIGESARGGRRAGHHSMRPESGDGARLALHAIGESARGGRRAGDHSMRSESGRAARRARRPKGEIAPRSGRERQVRLIRRKSGGAAQALARQARTRHSYDGRPCSPTRNLRSKASPCANVATTASRGERTPSHRRDHSTLRAHRAHLMWRNPGGAVRLALHPIGESTRGGTRAGHHSMRPESGDGVRRALHPIGESIRGGERAGHYSMRPESGRAARRARHPKGEITPRCTRHRRVRLIRRKSGGAAEARAMRADA